MHQYGHICYCIYILISKQIYHNHDLTSIKYKKYYMISLVKLTIIPEQLILTFIELMFEVTFYDNLKGISFWTINPYDKTIIMYFAFIPII